MRPEKMYNDDFETDTDMRNSDGSYWIRYKLVENNIDDTPTVDVPDINVGKKGKWVMENTGAMCSICGHKFYFEQLPNFIPIKPWWNYCPNCGADMRGGDE